MKTRKRKEGQDDSYEDESFIILAQFGLGKR